MYSETWFPKIQKRAIKSGNVFFFNAELNIRNLIVFEFRNPYTLEQRSVIDLAIANMQEFIRLMKYDPIPLQYYEM